MQRQTEEIFIGRMRANSRNATAVRAIPLQGNLVVPTDDLFRIAWGWAMC